MRTGSWAVPGPPGCSWAWRWGRFRPRGCRFLDGGVSPLLGASPRRDDERHHGLRGFVRAAPTTAASRHGGVAHQGGLDLSGGEPVPRDVLTSSTQQPNVAVFVPLVPSPAKYMFSNRDQYVSAKRSDHPRSRAAWTTGLPDDQETAVPVRDGLAHFVDNVHGDPGQRHLRRAELGGRDSGEQGNHLRAGLSLPEYRRCVALSPPMTLRYHIQASGLMGSPTEPSTRARRGRTSRISEPLHEGPDGGGRGVEDGDLVLFTISHQRPWCGESGVQPYITWVAPLMGGA